LITLRGKVEWHGIFILWFRPLKGECVSSLMRTSASIHRLILLLNHGAFFESAGLIGCPLFRYVGMNIGKGEGY
jgi:hypothetical protein